LKKIFVILTLLFYLNVSAQRGERINLEIKSLFLDTLQSWNQLIKLSQFENKFIYIFSNGDSPEYGYKLETEFLPQSIKKYLINNFILINLKTKYSINDGYSYTVIEQKFIDSIINVENISGMPVHLIYDKFGNPLAKSIFTFPDTIHRINYLRNILNGKNRYFPLLKEFKNGNRSADFIREFNRAYEGAVFYHSEDTVRIFKQFINAYKGKTLFTKANGKLIYDIANEEVLLYDDCSRNLFLNRKEWYKILGRQKVDNKIIEQLSDDLYTKAIFEVRLVNKLKCWEKAKEKYFKERKEYSEYDSVVLAKATTYYFQKQNVTDKFIESLPNYIKFCFKNDEKIENINNYTWEIFKRINDKEILEKTDNWCKDKLSKSKNHYYLDTYANLQYKLGNIKRAIKYETKAIKLAKDKEKIGYETNLQKMKNNQQTW
jgi:hypothetical protein